jgi:GNAT superfamily N-acetyltransferase
VNAESAQIRDALAGERAALERLQRESSDVWEQYREQLASHPDAIELPAAWIDNGWVRVAADTQDMPIGFSVVIPSDDGDYELDGLFVAPDRMHAGIGRALVQDACARAHADGATTLQVIAGPATGFYEKVGFEIVSSAQTRFGPAVRMRRRLQH